MVLESNLRCIKYIHFLTNPTKEACVYERLFLQLFIVTVKENKVH